MRRHWTAHDIAPDASLDPLMQHVREVLTTSSGSSCARHAVEWSEICRGELLRTASGEAPGRSVVDAEVAHLLLLCGEGRFVDAERGIVELLQDKGEFCLQDSEAFISVLNGLFVVQRTDLLAAMLKDRYGFARVLELSFGNGSVGTGGVRWDISSGGAHHFIFDAAVLRDDNTRLDILAFQWEFPLLANYASLDEQECGSVFLSRTDIGVKPGLAYCDNRADYFLIPDCVFVPSRGYSYARQVLRERRPRWEDRIPTAFWRGATTGIPAGPGDWRSLDRIKLCELAQRSENLGLIDAGISSIIQFTDPAIVKEIEISGLVRDVVPWEDWGRFKYHIDIDGNSSPWSNLFQRLLTGGTVLKVESRRRLEQWFYDKLIPWKNYVPISTDMSDLGDKVRWLNRHEDFARKVGESGLRLAEEMTYERELQRSIAVISSAFRYFRGQQTDIRPYGRADGA
jgi:hypothetical protein